MTLNENIKIALEQLDVALDTYDQEKYFAAITLAGAAEEIIGKVCREFRIENSLESIQKSMVLMAKVLYPTENIDEENIKKQAKNRANHARNKSKHINTIKEPEIDFEPKEEAKDIINRALDNWWDLGQPYNSKMLNFTNAK